MPGSQQEVQIDKEARSMIRSCSFHYCEIRYIHIQTTDDQALHLSHVTLACEFFGYFVWDCLDSGLNLFHAGFQHLFSIICAFNQIWVQVCHFRQRVSIRWPNHFGTTSSIAMILGASKSTITWHPKTRPRPLGVLESPSPGSKGTGTGFEGYHCLFAQGIPIAFWEGRPEQA